MVTRSSKTKRHFPMTILSPSVSPQCRSDIARETLIWLTETIITGSNNDRNLIPFICGTISVLRASVLRAEWKEWKWKEERREHKANKKKKSRKKSRQGNELQALCHVWLKRSKVQLAAFEYMTLQRQVVSLVTVEGNKWTTLYCSESLV